MEDKPNGNTGQQKETPDAGQPPPPPLIEKKEGSNTGNDRETSKEAPDTQAPPKTRWERFKAWIWPMDFSDAVMLVLTAAIAFGTIVSAVAIFLQWREMVNGGADTTAIKIAAQQQATAAQQFATATI
jgi:hypothetical protein